MVKPELELTPYLSNPVSEPDSGVAPIQPEQVSDQGTEPLNASKEAGDETSATPQNQGEAFHACESSCANGCKCGAVGNCLLCAADFWCLEYVRKEQDSSSLM